MIDVTVKTCDCELSLPSVTITVNGVTFGSLMTHPCRL